MSVRRALSLLSVVSWRPGAWWGRLQRLDGRWLQIAFLSSLLLFGVFEHEFVLQATQVMSAFAGALLAQFFWMWRLRLPQRRSAAGYLSAVITALGISMLVRADVVWMHAILAAMAVSSKFLVRAGPDIARSHVFNPANLAAALAGSAVVLPWLTGGAIKGLPHTWLSAGQWGFETLVAAWILALGGMVTGHIGRLDTSLSVLITWGVLLLGRLVYLGYEPDLAFELWWRGMCNGTLLLFAFFMISDPMTTPQQRRVRVAYAVAVAMLAFAWQYGAYRAHGLVWALLVCSVAVPWLNRWWPRPRFEWHHPPRAV